ncbi:hypothetical protein Q8791_10545 [Nocardiopsis sp. CT-R113]|uniref:DUF6924 domain-containing protein n=1 Tax=Nocardiopsis codii TaxID=3065942 RepID=A0ABU7K6K9_9ACTN|nr:hypothetical protein [Nocardiopsis sp. CT-R113]MEE2037657.1 hypothetical protein [Nocardiopsis sp. CT-R113]
MRPAIGISDVHRFAVVRTHHGDERAWRALLLALEAEYARYGSRPSRFLFVDDPGWAGATPEEVLEAVRDGDAEAVFLADEEALSEESWPLLTVYAPLPDEEPRPSEETLFRTGLDMVYYVDTNLSTGNTDVADFAAGAHEAPDGVLRFAAYFGQGRPQYPDASGPRFSFTPQALNLP